MSNQKISKMKDRRYRFITVLALLLLSMQTNGQFLMDMVDTSTQMGKGMLSIYQKFDNIKFSGYIQPQFQVAHAPGTKSFNGGDFPDSVNNRFMMRRGRIRIDYVHLNQEGMPGVQFVLQFDGSERGVFIRDFWGRVFENKFHFFAFTMGMFARPFSYELNLSSSDRESPERGRMSQLLMKTERDLGAMISFEPRKNHPLKYLKIDAGIFNGPGLSATTDFDSHKDFITRVAIKPIAVFRNNFLSAGISWFNGGMLQNTKYLYKVSSATKQFVIDSSLSNSGSIVPRKYYGADIQWKIKSKMGFTIFRAEYMFGKQTASHNSSETPAGKLNGTEGYYTRNFNGAYFYLLQNLFSLKHQLIVKYDWYDPNAEVKSNQITVPGGFTSADIKYSTLGLGYCYYINENVKALLWYEVVKNEGTGLPGYTEDVKDNVFTFRLQFRF